MSAESGSLWIFFVGLLVGLWRLGIIEKHLKEILAELRKVQPPAAPHDGN
jgi:hypothetical protein